MTNESKRIEFLKSTCERLKKEKDDKWKEIDGLDKKHRDLMSLFQCPVCGVAGYVLACKTISGNGCRKRHKARDEGLNLIGENIRKERSELSAQVKDINKEYNDKKNLLNQLNTDLFVNDIIKNKKNANTSMRLINVNDRYNIYSITNFLTNEKIMPLTKSQVDRLVNAGIEVEVLYYPSYG